jgi:hypothetical protein
MRLSQKVDAALLAVGDIHLVELAISHFTGPRPFAWPMISALLAVAGCFFMAVLPVKVPTFAIRDSNPLCCADGWR